MLTSDLEQLGLNKEEAKIYLAVLELGGSYVSVIAKKAKVHRVACYYTLEKLTKKRAFKQFFQKQHEVFFGRKPTDFG